MTNAKRDAVNAKSFEPLFDTIPAPIMIVARDSTIVYANSSAATQLGIAIPHLTNTKFSSLIENSSRPIFEAFLSNIFSSRDENRCKVRVANGNHNSFETIISANPFQGNGQCIFALQNSGNIPSAPDNHFCMEVIDKTSVGIHLVRCSDGTIVFANQSTERMFGYEAGELVGKHVSVLNASGVVSPEQQAADIIAHLNKHSTWVGDLENRTKNNARFWSHARVSEFTHPRLGNIWLCFHEDITARKQSEQELSDSRTQLRALLARINHAQNEERLRVAREIHDELGQILTTLNIEARSLERKLTEANLPLKYNTLIDRAVSLSELADRTIEVVQKIATGLRSTEIEQLGIISAFVNKALRFEERTGIKCSVIAPAHLPEPPLSVTTELYLICREALTNIARHSQASRVEIKISPGSDFLIFEVSDDGIGIDLQKLNAPTSLGLLGMRERSRQIGANLSINNNNKKGTVISVSVPNQILSGVGSVNKP